MRINKEDSNINFYLSVEPHYGEPTEGKGKQDAVLFEMGQVSKGKEEIDSSFAVPVVAARSFAYLILQTCDEIELKKGNTVEEYGREEETK